MLNKVSISGYTTPAKITATKYPAKIKGRRWATLRLVLILSSPEFGI
jgi:hypothetical protein